MFAHPATATDVVTACSATAQRIIILNVLQAAGPREQSTACLHYCSNTCYPDHPPASGMATEGIDGLSKMKQQK